MESGTRFILLIAVGPTESIMVAVSKQTFPLKLVFLENLTNDSFENIIDIILCC